MTTLPISVIVPTRNAMGSIEAHVEAISAWLPQVAQVVVVDSSEDGTLDFLREKLAALPHVEFHSRPPGLYESWNFAVRRTSAEYVYFSTVGDGIELGGLPHLLAVARETNAEMVLSPPEMLDETGGPHIRRWPIHLLCDEIRGDGPCVLEPDEAFILTTTPLPSTVLGSSASNIYRREFLAERPFPEGWGHDADSAWMVSNCMQARIAVTKRCVSRFVVHDVKDPTDKLGNAFRIDRFERMAQRATRAVRSSPLDERRKDVLAGWDACLNFRVQQFLRRIALVTEHVGQRDRRIEALLGEATKLKERIVRLETRLAEERATVANFREKIVAARNELAEHERRHRSAFAVIGLYFQAKRQQARRLFALLFARKNLRK